MTLSDEGTKVGWLLKDLCVELGHCSASREPERFEELVPLGADAFADAVLVAEGINPEYEKQLRSQVREFVAARFARWGPAGAA